LHRSNGVFPFKTNTGAPTDPADIADNETVFKLRDRSRYLMPNGRFDLIVSLAIMFRGLAVNAVMVAFALFTAAAVTLFLFPEESRLAHSHIIDLLKLVAPASATTIYAALGNWFITTKLLLIFSCFWFVTWAVFRSLTTTAVRATDSILSDPASLLARTTGVLLIVTGVFAIAEAQPFLIAHLIRWFVSPDGWLASIFNLRTLLLASAAIAIGAIAWRFLIQTLQVLERDSSWPALFKKFGANIVLLALAAALPLLIYGAYLVLVMAGISQNEAFTPVAALLAQLPDGHIRSLLVAFPILIVATYVVLQWLWGPLPDTLFNPGWWKGTAFRVRSFYAGLVAVLGFMLLAFIFSKWLADPLLKLLPHSDVAWAYAALASVLGLVVILFTENANSLHRLYRDRLEEAFSLRGNNDTRLRLSHLKKLDSGTALKPYPIINATVNIKASPNNRRARNADFFIFTPDHVGSDATGYTETEAFEQAEPHMDLATAVAISGAAVSSAMGRVGSSVLSPTLALLNLRLGFWVRNPRYAHSGEARAIASRADWNFLYMLREIFGRLTDASRKVYVTDGGHIDNLGLRELLKRRCEIILVSDAEQDPAMTFGSFVDVERFSRIDLGVRFDLPLETIRTAGLQRKAEKDTAPDQTYKAPASAHAAIGEIHYPASAGGAAAKEGIILYIKASLTGDEREYVLDYERRNPQFPYEPTSDQFFTEEQFEVYRALGFHAASGALSYTDGSDRWTRLLETVHRRLQI
jgi:hypothetical protein